MVKSHQTLTYGGNEVKTPEFAGTYQLTITVTGDQGYNDYTKTYTFDTTGNNKANSTLKYSVADKTWGNKIVLKNDAISTEKRTPNATAAVSGTTLTGKKVSLNATVEGSKDSKGNAIEGSYDLTGTENLKPGTYTATISFGSEAAYGQNATTKTFKFNVAKRNVNVASENAEVPYKGAAYYPLDYAKYTLTNAEKKETVITPKNTTVTGDGVNHGYYVVDSGKYTVNFTLTDADAELYNAPTTATFNVVGDRDQTVTLTVNDKDYDSDPAEVKAVGQSTGAVTYTYKDADGKTLAAAPTDAGKYTVTATVAGDKNYKSGTATKSFEIRQATIYVDDINDNINFDTLTYNGKKQVPNTTLVANLDGISGGQTGIHKKKITLTSDKDFKLEIAKDDEGANAGKHTAVLTLLNKNYKLADRHLGTNGKTADVESANVTYTIYQYTYRS